MNLHLDGARTADRLAPTDITGATPPVDLGLRWIHSFAQLGPSAAALLAQYGYGSVAAGVPAGGSAVPAALGPAAGAYPRVDASAWLQKAAPAP